MPENVIIRCLNCGTKNRIPNQKFQKHPICGNCHAPLDDLIIRCLKCGTKNRISEEKLNQKPLCGKCHEPLVIAQQQIKPLEVTDDSFGREVLTGDISVLVDCWAPWCAPCHKLSPVIEELASDYANGVKVAKLNVDENPVTAAQYGIRSIPTMLLFKDGKLVQRLVGALPKEEIEKSLLSIIKTN
ncbi:MAG: thioredoxin [Deltaproteobacteria bacterium HGW-Deltaproteobacteria-10]|nr:MAG: thioredoxin [Deltaproteobacteria bacterium HGW-Deltaproteobacteria-10]